MQQTLCVLLSYSSCKVSIKKVISLKKCHSSVFATAAIFSHFCLPLFLSFCIHYASDTSPPELLSLHAPVAGQAQPLTQLYLHTHYLQMMSGCLPQSLVESADLFTATSQQHLLVASFQPRWLINIAITRHLAAKLV